MFQPEPVGSCDNDVPATGRGDGGWFGESGSSDHNVCGDGPLLVFDLVKVSEIAYEVMIPAMRKLLAEYAGVPK